MTDRPPYGPPAGWDRDPDRYRPQWIDQWWWVPVALLGTWMLSPVWVAGWKAGGWQRALAAIGIALVAVGFGNLTRRRRWFHRHTHQEDRR